MINNAKHPASRQTPTKEDGKGVRKRSAAATTTIATVETDITASPANMP